MVNDHHRKPMHASCLARAKLVDKSLSIQGTGHGVAKHYTFTLELILCGRGWCDVSSSVSAKNIQLTGKY